MLPYGRPWLTEEDVAAVAEVLQTDWLTTGPKVGEFERVFANFVGAVDAVAVSSGTAALHTALDAVGIGSGDEVIVPAMTFAASANCVVFQGASPIFTDVDPATLLIDPTQVERNLTQRTKAIITVDYTGQACEYEALREVARVHRLVLVADACHALGGAYRGRAVGSVADISTFSLHPVKAITSGEGGVITTDNLEWASRMRIFRNHGITSTHRDREQQGAWFYEMVQLGFNYRLTDIQCALGISQLRRLSEWIERRQMIARRYDQALQQLPAVESLKVRDDISHAYHLYVIRLELERLRVDRNAILAALREEGVGVNVHYIPVHLHPYYRQRYGTGPGMCPVAEAAYERILTLPIFPRMTDMEISAVIQAVSKVVRRNLA